MKNSNTKRTRKKLPLTLEQRINLAGIGPNLLSAAVIFCYSVAAAQVPSSLYRPALNFIVPMVLVMQLVISPVVLHIFFGGTSRRLAEFGRREFSEDERMALFKAVSQMPLTYAFVVFAFFVAGSIVFFCIFFFMLKLQLNVAVLLLLQCLFGSYMAACISFLYSRGMVTESLHAIVRAGLPKAEVYAKKVYGRTLAAQTAIFLIAPLAMTAVFSVFIVIIGYSPAGSNALWPNPSVQMRRMAIVTVMNCCCQVLLTLLFNRQINESVGKMTGALESLARDVASSQAIDTDIHDEISYNQFLANEMVGYLRAIVDKTVETGGEVDMSSMELVKVSSDTESTAVEQSTATNEIVATMEDASRLAQDVEARIIQVSEVAEQTAANVASGLSLIESNLAKMAEIAQANEETIAGIHQVSEKTGSIWDIISIINSIADNTKIIAFNAELEATNVREKGRNFKNVANEIRRLANSTMDSTKEIKGHINNIQAATDKLIACAETSTQTISRGVSLVHTLEAALASINNSAQATAESSSEIKQRISQETDAFRQIVETLHQISRSIESFSSSTHAIMDTAFALQKNANDLASICFSSEVN